MFNITKKAPNKEGSNRTKRSRQKNEIFKQFYFVPILFQVQIGITYTPDPNQRVR